MRIEVNISRLLSQCCIYIALLVVNVNVNAADPEPSPQVWMSALHLPIEMAEREAEWSFVLEHLDGFKFWSGQLDWNENGVPGRLVQLFAARKIAVASERMYWPPEKVEGASDTSHGLAGPLDDTIGERAAANEMQRIKACEQMGGSLAFVDVDDPLRNLIHPHWPARFGGGLSPDDAVREIVDYMLAVQRERPDVGFFIIVNFPLWGWKGQPSYVGNEFLGDYHPLVEKLISQSRERRAPLRGWTVDFPREYATGELRADWLAGPPWNPSSVDWLGRILELEQFVKQSDLEFNLVINDGATGEKSQAEHNRATLDMLDRYQKRGGSPHRYVVQSWFSHPTSAEVFPETNPDSLTGLVRAVIERVKPQPNCTSAK